MTYNDLPAINAVLNSLSTIFIVAGLIFIKSGNRRAHGLSMVCALFTSAAFLTCYLIYHTLRVRDTGAAHTSFDAAYGAGIRTTYLVLLFSHIILAVVNLPMIIRTVWFAATKQFDRHRKIARKTMPIWLYVSVTGVIVYLMLYQWYPPQSLLERRAKAAAAAEK